MPEVISSPISNRYYPSLSELFQIDDLPESLSFIQDSIGKILSSIYYKNLQYSKSPDGSSGQYNLDVISRERIELELISGIKLVVNPDSSGDFSSFPISVQYQTSPQM